jgi:GTP pyrophosphokinase
VHIDMGHEGAQNDVEFRFVVGVRDTGHLAVALRNLNRTAAVMRAERRKVSTVGQSAAGAG